MKKSKYVKFFESYINTDFNYKSQFIGKLEQEDQSFLDELKSIFIDGSFRYIYSSDGGAIVGSGAGKRNVNQISFNFILRGENGSNSYRVSIDKFLGSNSGIGVTSMENPYGIYITNIYDTNDLIEKSFKSKEELLKFIKESYKLRKFFK